MQIKFIKSPSGAPYNLAHFTGDVVELPTKQAQELIDQGFAVVADIEETGAPKKKRAPRKKATPKKEQ